MKGEKHQCGYFYLFFFTFCFCFTLIFTQKKYRVDSDLFTMLYKQRSQTSYYTVILYLQRETLPPFIFLPISYLQYTLFWNTNPWVSVKYRCRDYSFAEASLIFFSSLTSFISVSLTFSLYMTFFFFGLRKLKKFSPRKLLFIFQFF